MSVDTAPASWPLARESYEDVKRLSLRLSLNDPVVAASTEVKAIETAEALELGTVRSMSNFNEVRKPWYEDPADHHSAMAQYLAGGALAGWEPLQDAVQRFSSGIREVAGRGDVVIATHGTVMSAWLGSTGIVRDPFEFWAALTLPDAWEIDMNTREISRLGLPSN